MKKILVLSVLLSLVILKSGYAEEALTWQDCIKEAQKNHPDLISSEEGIRQYEAARNITYSGSLPQVSGTAGASTTKSIDVAAGRKTAQKSDSYSYGVTATQDIFDGFKKQENLNSAAEDIRAAQYNYRYTSSLVRLRLKTAFINLLKDQELLNITQEIYDIRRGNLELISLRYESGLEHKGALLNAQANLAQSEFEISQAKRGLEVSQRQLLKEMGRAQFSALRAKGDLRAGDIPKDKPDFEALAKNHPSLQKLIAQKNAAAFDIKATQADYYPELSASAGADKSGSRLPLRNSQWNAGLTVTMPLFEGGLRKSEVAQSRALYNQAVANVKSSSDSIIVSLQEYWSSLQDAVEMLEVKRKFLDAALARAQIAEAQYSLGLIQFDSWTIIEDNLVSAKTAFLDSQANVLLAEANWIQAKGETLEYAK